MIDFTITIGNIIEISGLIVIMIAGGVMLKATVGRLTDDVSDMKVSIKSLNKVVIEMAVTHTRLDAIEQDIRELRHGRGFIREAIDGEWPRDRS